ncbi:MAG: diguanylate cyclase domain-containing protein [Gammaproteobacteria bacterium]
MNIPSLSQKPTPITAPLISALYQRTPIELFVGTTFALGITGIGWIAYASRWAIAWAAAILLLYGIRRLAAHSFTHASAKKGGVGRWFFIFGLGISLTGLAWGFAGAAAAQSGSMGFVAAVAVAIGCVALVTTVTYYGMLRVSALFLAPAVAPPVYFLLAEPRPSTLLAGGLVCVFSLMLFLAALLLRKGFLASISISQTNEALRAERHRDREEIKRLSVALKTNAQKRDQLEQESRKLAADLALLKGKTRVLSNTLREVAPLCPVTGLTTRKYFNDAMDSEWHRCLREKKPLSLIAFTLDDFGRFQESYGAKAVETWFRQGATIVKQFARRAGDMAARFDEHSFALLLPGADTRKAMQISEQVRIAIERLGVPHADLSAHPVATIHAGLATMIPSADTSARDLLARADAALYEAQFQGGNRVVAYRTLSRFRREAWVTAADGPLTELALRQKLLLWGFEGEWDTFAPQTRLPDQNASRERVCAILCGHLRVTVEGQWLDLKPGDTLFIPAGTNCAFEVIGQEPLVCYAGTSHIGAAKTA